MYCSSCGTAVAEGLTYCNRCGARLVGMDRSGNESAGLKPNLIVSCMASVFVFGMMTIAGMMVVMKDLPGFDFGRIMAVIMLGFLMMLLVEGVFVTLLFRRRSVAKAGQSLSKDQTTNELDAAHLRALPDHMPSVTEHATRKFEPAYVERKSE